VNISQFIGGKWNRTEISELTYLGGGLYKVTLKEPLSYGKRVKMLVLVPGDEVLVGASNIVGLGMPWNTLYYLSPSYLSPQLIVSSPSHLIQPYSHGKGKSVIKLRTRQLTPYDILLEDYVIVIMLLRRNPPKADIAWVDLTFGYIKDNKENPISSSHYDSLQYGGTNELISAFKNGNIRLEIPQDKRMIPQNSIIYLLVTVQLSETPYGTTMVECGFRFDSRIDLAFPPSITDVNYTYSYDASKGTFSVKAKVTDIGSGGSAIYEAKFWLSSPTEETGYVDMENVTGSFGKDPTVIVYGTMDLPKDFVSGNYTLEIEALDATGSIARREIPIKHITDVTYTYSYNASKGTFSVKAKVTDIGSGGSAINWTRFQLSNAAWNSGYVDMENVTGSFGKDPTVIVYGTMDLPKDFVSGNYTLEIEALDATGSIARREIQIQNFDPKTDSGQSFP
jgi:hypothetical protein